MADNSIDLKIEAVLKTANATSDLTVLKKSLKELTSMAIEYGDTNEAAFQKVASAAGEIKDKIQDARASISAVSGKPIENLASSLNLARGSLQNLDFSQASTSIKLLSSNIKGLKFGDLSGGVGELSSSLVDLGKAILTNPLLLLAGIVLLLISKFDDLKASGGVIGKVFTAIGEAIKSITDAITAFTDAIGLTAVASQKKTQQILDGLEKEKNALIERYDLETKLATDQNKNTELVEAKKLNAIEENAKATIAVYNQLKAENGKLTDKQREELEKTQKSYEQSQNDKLEFLTRVSSLAINSEKDTQFQIEQNRINLMAEGAGKVAAQTALDRKKQTKDDKIDLDKRLDQLHSYYTARLHGLDRSSTEAIELRKEEQTQLTKIEKEGEQKSSDLQKEQNKKIRDDSLVRRASLLSDAQKLAQDRLQLDLDNFKISDAVKLQAQKNYIDKSIQLSNQVFDVQIKQAAGSVEKQKGLEEEKLLAVKKFRQEEEKLEKDFANKQEKLAIDKHNQMLENNIKNAELLKEFSKTYKQSLDADLAVLSANNAKVVSDDWNTYREKIKNVNISSIEKQKILDEYNQKEIDNNDALKKRLAKINEDYQRQQNDLLNRNLAETSQVELDNLKRKGGFNLSGELKIIEKINAEKSLALQNQMNEELKAVSDNEQQKNIIREKFKQLEIQQGEDAKQAKIKAVADSAEKVTGYLQAGADAAGAISDIASNLEEKKRDKNGKLSLDIQKKQFTRNKALGIANAVINTAASIAKTIGELGLPAGLPASIAAGVMGALQIAKIASTQFKPESGGSGSSGASISAPSIASAPSLGGNASLLRSQQSLQANKINSFGSGNAPVTVHMAPIRVSVVESDISRAQANANVVQNRAMLVGP